MEKVTSVLIEDSESGVLEWGSIDDRLESEAPATFARMRGMRVCSQDEVLSLIHRSSGR